METVKENKKQSPQRKSAANPPQRKSAADPQRKKSSFEDQFEKLDLNIHGVRLPEFTIEKEYLSLIDNPEKIKNTYDFLIALCQK